mmetsp:Transcript_14980/g.17232  ORF Transcript_14980/g.17232 Transcript_14980/m.17232 type:complete len:216 (-) Transcript_14980:129-776(-)
MTNPLFMVAILLLLTKQGTGAGVGSQCAFTPNSRIRIRNPLSVINSSSSITRSQQTITTRPGINFQTSTSSLPKLSLTQLQMAGKVVGKSGGKMITTPNSFSDLVLFDLKNDSETASTTAAPVQLVYFSAAWCGPCRLTHPVVKDIGKEFASKINVYEINTDDMPDTAESQGVVSIPTIQLYSGGVLKDTIIGCVAKNVLAASVAKLLEEVALNE